jgi:hypothetical protein
MKTSNNTVLEKYKKYYLSPGFVYVPEEPTVITTVLGS